MRRDGKGELRFRIKKDVKILRSECLVLIINVIILDILGGGGGLGLLKYFLFVLIRSWIEWYF